MQTPEEKGCPGSHVGSACSACVRRRIAYTTLSWFLSTAQLSQSQMSASAEVRHGFLIIPYLQRPHRSSIFPGSSPGNTILWCMFIYLFIIGSFPCGFDLFSWLQTHVVYGGVHFLPHCRHMDSCFLDWGTLRKHSSPARVFYGKRKEKKKTCGSSWNPWVQHPVSQFVWLHIWSSWTNRREDRLWTFQREEAWSSWDST